MEEIKCNPLKCLVVKRIATMTAKTIEVPEDMAIQTPFGIAKIQKGLKVKFATEELKPIDGLVVNCGYRNSDGTCRKEGVIQETQVY